MITLKRSESSPVLAVDTPEIEGERERRKERHLRRTISGNEHKGMTKMRETQNRRSTKEAYLCQVNINIKNC